MILNNYSEQVILTKEQQACVDYKGVKAPDLTIQGIAGSGKSLALIVRAIKCITDYPDDTVAVFAFNNTLAKSIEETMLVNKIDVSKIHISTLDSYLNSVFQKLPGHFYGHVAYEKAEIGFMEQALKNHEMRIKTHHRFHDVKAEYWLSEVHWMKQRNIGEQDLARYVEMKRVGRGRDVRVTAQEKPIVFQIYLEYSLVLKSKRLHEWEDRYLYISHNIDKIPEDMKYNHIFIDEAQDQSLTKMIALTGLKSETAKGCPPSITIAMDMNQQIFGRQNKIPGLQATTKKLTKTYRCSAEIDALAESLRKNNDPFLEEEDRNPHIVPSRHSTLPVIHECYNMADEKRFISELIKQWQRKDENITVCILSTTNNQNDMYSEWLTDAGIEHEKITKDNEFSIWKAGVKVSTIYNAKGMEFTHVIIPQFEERRLPNIHEKTDEELIQEELIRNRAVAYVGMTRAMQGLVLTYSGTPSRFIAEMDKELYRYEKSEAPVQQGNAPISKAHGTSKTSIPRIGENSGLKQYFESKGREVIDKRDNKGCLWVVGNEEELHPYIEEVKVKFRAWGNFGAGRATGGRRGWFTKCKR